MEHGPSFSGIDAPRLRGLNLILTVFCLRKSTSFIRFLSFFQEKAAKETSATLDVLRKTEHGLTPCSVPASSPDREKLKSHTESHTGSLCSSLLHKSNN